VYFYKKNSGTYSFKNSHNIIISETEREGVNWSHLGQDRDQWRGGGTSCEHGNEPSVSIKGWEPLD